MGQIENTGKSYTPTTPSGTTSLYAYSREARGEKGPETKGKQPRPTVPAAPTPLSPSIWPYSNDYRANAYNTSSNDHQPDTSGNEITDEVTNNTPIQPAELPATPPAPDNSTLDVPETSQQHDTDSEEVEYIDSDTLEKAEIAATQVAKTALDILVSGTPDALTLAIAINDIIPSDLGENPSDDAIINAARNHIEGDKDHTGLIDDLFIKPSTYEVIDTLYVVGDSEVATRLERKFEDQVDALMQGIFDRRNEQVKSLGKLDGVAEEYVSLIESTFYPLIVGNRQILFDNGFAELPQTDESRNELVGLLAAQFGLPNTGETKSTTETRLNTKFAAAEIDLEWLPENIRLLQALQHHPLIESRLTTDEARPALTPLQTRQLLENLSDTEIILSNNALPEDQERLRKDARIPDWSLDVMNALIEHAKVLGVDLQPFALKPGTTVEQHQQVMTYFEALFDAALSEEFWKRGGSATIQTLNEALLLARTNRRIEENLSLDAGLLSLEELVQKARDEVTLTYAAEFAALERAEEAAYKGMPPVDAPVQPAPEAPKQLTLEEASTIRYNTANISTAATLENLHLPEAALSSALAVSADETSDEGMENPALETAGEGRVHTIIFEGSDSYTIRDSDGSMRGFGWGTPPEFLSDSSMETADTTVPETAKPTQLPHHLDESQMTADELAAFRQKEREALERSYILRELNAIGVIRVPENATNDDLRAIIDPEFRMKVLKEQQAARNEAQEALRQQRLAAIPGQLAQLREMQARNQQMQIQVRRDLFEMHLDGAARAAIQAPRGQLWGKPTALFPNF